jgi:DNA-binding NarL/FixJ family response regulator
MGVFTSSYCLDDQHKTCSRQVYPGRHCGCWCHYPVAIPSTPKTEPEISLTRQQTEALQDVADGKSLKDSAAARGISASALTSRRTAAFRALGARSRHEAVRIARQKKLIH